MINHKELLFRLHYPLTAKNNIERACTAVTRVSISDCSNIASMARSRQPITDRGPNTPTRNRQFAARWLAGNQKEYSDALLDCLIKAIVKQGVSSSKIVPVKINTHFRLHYATAKAPIPTTIQICARLDPSGGLAGR
jgi:hypothetical protein